MSDDQYIFYTSRGIPVDFSHLDKRREIALYHYTKMTIDRLICEVGEEKAIDDMIRTIVALIVITPAEDQDKSFDRIKKGLNDFDLLMTMKTSEDENEY
jgi:hypothetical protein